MYMFMYKLYSWQLWELHVYSCLLQAAVDGDRVIDELKRSISRSTAFDCVMRVRCSSG